MEMRRYVAVVPALGVAALHAPALFHRVGQRAQQHLVVIAEPAGGALAQQALHHHRSHVELVGQPGGRGGILGDRAAHVLVCQRDQERRGKILIHLAVPGAQQAYRGVQAGVVCVALLVRAHQLARQKMAERRIDVLLHGQHVLGAPSVVRGEQRANLLGAVRRREVSVDRVGKVRGKRILVGGDDHPARRIVDARQLVERNVAVPLEVARRAIHRYVAAIVAAPRQRAGGVVADIAIHIGIHEVRSRSRQARDRGRELLPVLRAIDIDEWKLQHAGLGGGPAQRQPLLAVGEKDRTVARHPDRHLHVRPAP